MSSDVQLYAAILAKLTAGKPAAQELMTILDTLPEHERGGVARAVNKYGLGTDLVGLCDSSDKTNRPLELLTADDILLKDWPEPVWAVPGLLPVGLAILAGAPKVGKSWLALQIAQAVAAGGYVFGQEVTRGPVLYLALEDPPRRLKERMKKQGWPSGLGCEADFMTVGSFMDKIGDLRNGGGERLTRQIETRRYRLVVIDTLSRAVAGDQNEAHEMTAWLTPVQELAHSQNCAVVLVDHHRKGGGSGDPDAIGDILGSTAKGAMSDTALGLYRERGKPGARLALTGREVEEKTLDVKMDWHTGCWQLDSSSEGLTPQQSDLLDALESIGPAGVQDIADAVGRNRGNVYKQLAELERKGKVTREEKLWKKVPF